MGGSNPRLVLVGCEGAATAIASQCRRQRRLTVAVLLPIKLWRSLRCHPLRWRWMLSLRTWSALLLLANLEMEFRLPLCRSNPPLRRQRSFASDLQAFPSTLSARVRVHSSRTFVSASRKGNVSKQENVSSLWPDCRLSGAIRLGTAVGQDTAISRTAVSADARHEYALPAEGATEGKA